MNEPDNLTGWVDSSGGTWVRVDDCPGTAGTWYPRLNGPGFDPGEWDSIGQGHSFEDVLENWPVLTPAAPELTAETIDLVRRAWSR